MSIQSVRQIASTGIPDDAPINITRRDLSGGVNSRQYGNEIGETQSTVLLNVDIGTAGKASKRPGSVLIANDVGANTILGLHNFEIQGATDQLLAYEGTKIWKWDGSAATWTDLGHTFSATTEVGMISAKQSGVSPDDVVIIQNGVDNAHSLTSAGTITDLQSTTYYSMPKTTVMAWYGNRVWALVNDLLYFSDAYPSTYAPTMAAITSSANSFTGTGTDKIKVTIDSVVFDNIDVSACTNIAGVVTAINTATSGTQAASVDGYLVITSTTRGATSNVTIADGSSTGATCVGRLFATTASRTNTGLSPWDTVTNVYRVPVGQERGIVPIRDTGMIIMGQDAIWGLAPSATPAATDKPEPLVTNRGVVSKKGWVNAGDDVYYFAQDGFRALQRTQQDKLQAGTDYPLSYYLKDEFDRINFGYIDRVCMEYFDNKIFIAVPTGAATFDTWVYYPDAKSFMVIQGWSPRCWARYKIDGEEYLYYGKHGDGTVYKAWSGYSDEGTTATNGTAINYQEEGRKEDCGQPLVKKCGGIIRVRALSSGDYNLTVYASVDDGSYVTLGTMALTGNSPTLPVNLPFTLASANILTEEFHIDSLGEWNTLRIKIVHNAANGSDDITVLERSVITYANAYQEEGG